MDPLCSKYLMERGNIWFAEWLKLMPLIDTFDSSWQYSPDFTARRPGLRRPVHLPLLASLARSWAGRLGQNGSWQFPRRRPYRRWAFNGLSTNCFPSDDFWARVWRARAISKCQRACRHPDWRGRNSIRPRCPNQHKTLWHKNLEHATRLLCSQLDPWSTESCE